MINKKGLSAMIGYVLLITFGIVMAVIVYAYLKTYIPTEPTACPEGSSVFLKEYSCSGNKLNLTVKNNGRFNIAGYFIYGTNNTEQKIATTAMYENYTEKTHVVQGAILFSPQDPQGAMKPGLEMNGTFNVSNDLVRIDLLPVRIEGEGQDLKFVVCGNARIKEEIICS